MKKINAKQCDVNKPRNEVQWQKGIFRGYIKLRESYHYLKMGTLIRLPIADQFLVLSQFSQNSELRHL